MTPAPGTVRILTWNIHGGVGRDGRLDLDRIAAMVRGHHPDVVALQEVDSRRPTGQRPAFAYLAEMLGIHSVDAKAITAPDGDYGHILISRFPLTWSALHDISVSGREPRRAIEALVATPGGPLHVVAAHLGLGFGERRRQASLLARIAASSGEVAVMVGDFNDWLWRGTVRRTLNHLDYGRTKHRTFPAGLPLLMLDRVYCRPHRALVRSWTDPSARAVSDHLPVIADIALSVA